MLYLLNLSGNVMPAEVYDLEMTTSPPSGQSGFQVCGGIYPACLSGHTYKIEFRGTQFTAVHFAIFRTPDIRATTPTREVIASGDLTNPSAAGAVITVNYSAS